MIHHVAWLARVWENLVPGVEPVVNIANLKFHLVVHFVPIQHRPHNCSVWSVNPETAYLLTHLTSIVASNRLRNPSLLSLMNESSCSPPSYVRVQSLNYFIHVLRLVPGRREFTAHLAFLREIYVNHLKASTT